MRKVTGILAIFLLVLSAGLQAQVTLSRKSFQELAASRGLVILHVNWGRYWKCGAFENAQLQRLTFRRIAGDGTGTADADWELSPASVLLAKSSFQPYTVYLEPGRYALGGFRFKVTRSAADIQVAEPGPAELIVDGKPVAGSFTVAPGETVYVGHFGVDCDGEPTPWRFYIDGRAAFEEYVAGFRKQFPFMQEVPVTFRLFETSTLGNPYELPK